MGYHRIHCMTLWWFLNLCRVQVTWLNVVEAKQAGYGFTPLNANKKNYGGQKDRGRL